MARERFNIFTLTEGTLLHNTAIWDCGVSLGNERQVSCIVMPARGSDVMAKTSYGHFYKRAVGA